jgi:hypothetical protein
MFFWQAFLNLGGVGQRESRRYEVTYVPATIRYRDRLIGTAESVQPHYERLAFEKDFIWAGRPSLLLPFSAESILCPPVVVFPVKISY